MTAWVRRVARCSLNGRRKRDGRYRLVRDVELGPLLLIDPDGRRNNLRAVLPEFSAAAADFIEAYAVRVADQQQHGEVPLRRSAVRLAISLSTLKAWRRRSPRHTAQHDPGADIATPLPLRLRTTV